MNCEKIKLYAASLIHKLHRNLFTSNVCGVILMLKLDKMRSKRRKPLENTLHLQRIIAIARLVA